MINEVSAQLNQQGGYVSANKETVQRLLPYYNELDHEKGGVDAATRRDVQLIMREIHHQAIDQGRNIIVEGAQGDPQESLNLAKSLRANGYHVEIHAASVNDQISYARAVTMYEQEKTSGHVGKFVGLQEHGQGFADAAETVRRLEYAGAADRIVVYNRLNDPVHDAKPEPGKTTAAAAFDRARAQLTDYERINLAEKWDAVVESMERRGALPAELDRIKEPVERAHYSLRQSPAALEAYNYQHPTERHRSSELAETYGAKLEASFRQERRSDATHRPELTNAFAQLAVAERLAQETGGAAGARFSAAIVDRIAGGLNVGSEFKNVVVHDPRTEPTKAERAQVEHER